MAARKCFSNLCSAIFCSESFFLVPMSSVPMAGFYFVPLALQIHKQFLICFVRRRGTRIPRLFRRFKMFTLRRTALLALIGFAFTSLAVGQTQITTGVIQGTIFDQSGAVLPGADVVATNVNTQAAATQKTDGDGRFVFLSLSPGGYSVTASKAGFSKLVQKDVILTVGQALNLKITLKISATSEVVEVTGTPIIETTQTASRTTLDENTLSHTPLFGR